MNERILSSPVRLIVFQSGKYEFAEVRLDAPLHLMGPNNIGKTSLIAMLQFLYIDQQRHMHFSYPLPETRRYYFPHTSSYILFECRTPEGFRVVGVHGLGPARQYEFERFSYRGRFEVEDFLDEDRRVRESGEVKARLAGKNYVRLEPMHLRAALTGIGEDRGVSLGLVPLRDRGQYARFRFLFCNLLRLAQLRQDELKELLIEIYRSEFQQVKIEMNRDYRERYVRLQRDAQTVRELRWIEKDVERLTALIDERDRARGQLPVLWGELGRGFTARENAIREQMQEVLKQSERLRAEEEQVRAICDELDERRMKRLTRCGELRNQEEELQRLEKDLEGFIDAWAQQRLQELEKQSALLRTRLSDLEGDDPVRVEQRLKKWKDRLRILDQRRDAAETLLLSVAQKAFDPEELSSLFQILNPALLDLDADQARIEHRTRLVKRLREFGARVSGGIYRDDDLTLELPALSGSDLSGWLDPVQSELDRDEAERQVLRETDLLESARDGDGCAKRLQALDRERGELSRKRHRQEELERRRGDAATLKDDLRQLTDEVTSLTAEIKCRTERIHAIEKEQQRVKDHAGTLRAEEALLLKQRRDLLAPDPDWSPAEDVEIPEDLDDLIDLYRHRSGDQRRLSEESELQLNSIHERTAEHYLGKNEAESIARLMEAVDALGQREEALRRNWADLAVGLRSAFSALVHDLHRLEGRVADLNRRIGKTAVSNLEAIRLIVSERPEWTRRIRTMCDLQEDLPLFGSSVDGGDAAELGRMLEQTPEVGLEQLFDLHFEVCGMDGRERRYHNLAQIESNGTTITIKVLVHLILLRDLMSTGRAGVPFYLDEVSSLDHDNIEAIIAQATSLDFIPVLASPEPVEEVDRIYMLCENDAGRILLDSTALIELHRNPSEGEGGAGITERTGEGMQPRGDATE